MPVARLPVRPLHGAGSAGLHRLRAALRAGHEGHSDLSAGPAAAPVMTPGGNRETGNAMDRAKLLRRGVWLATATAAGNLGLGVIAVRAGTRAGAGAVGPGRSPLWPSSRSPSERASRAGAGSVAIHTEAYPRSRSRSETHAL